MSDREADSEHFKIPWKLRIFFSIDMIGSTAMKQEPEQNDAVPTWRLAIREFVKQFPILLQSQYAEIGEREDLPKVAPVNLWKFSGDELLFEQCISSPFDVLVHTLAIKKAVVAWPKQAKKAKNPRLKATGWIGGFPVANSIISVEGKDDYVGPSIDIGFRLTKFANERRFPVSIELAWMLLDAFEELQFFENTSPFDWYLEYGGIEVMKGVMQGRGYPLVWLDMLDGVPTVEDSLIGKNRVSDFHALLRDYLDRFFGNDGFLVKPFIAEGESKIAEVKITYGEFPDWPDTLQLEIVKMLNEMAEAEQQIGNDLPENEPPGIQLDAPSID